MQKANRQKYHWTNNFSGCKYIKNITMSKDVADDSRNIATLVVNQPLPPEPRSGLEMLIMKLFGFFIKW